MKSEKTDKPKVTNRNIEKLLKELMPHWNTKTRCSEELENLSKEHAALQRSLMRNSRLVKLQKFIDSLKEEHDKINKEKGNKIAKIRQRYWAEGATPRVVEAITKLLDEEDSNA